MEMNKNSIYGCDEAMKNQTINYINRLCYQAGVKNPAKPMFGGCFYDKNFNQIYIKEIIYNDPAVIVFWSDGTKTTAKCHDVDTFDTEKGVMLCVIKKLVDSDFAVKTIEDWGAPAPGKNKKTLSEVRSYHRKDS